MADTPVPAAEAAAPAPAPAVTSEQIQALIAEGVKAAFDSRIPGLQSTYEKQLADVRSQLKRSQMTDDEWEDERAKALEQELAQARRERDALKAAAMYPTAFPLFEKLQSASTVEEQLSFLSTLVPAPAAPAPEPEPQAPPVPRPDLNNPPQQNATFASGAPMTKDLADRILGAFDRWPGKT